MVMARLTAIWEAETLRTPRVSIGFKVLSEGSITLCYSTERSIVTDAFRDDKTRRVIRKQDHLREVAQKAIAAHALGSPLTLEIDL